MNARNVVVTGAAGFIGCNLVRHLLAASYRVAALDKLTYAGHRESLAEHAANRDFHFVQADIADQRAVLNLLATYKPGAILNLAAETHVDRSIDRPVSFVETNVVGTHGLLEATLRHWRGLAPRERDDFRLVHVSTDEVYGTLGAGGFFTEETPYAPNSPYAASKAAADHFVRAYRETYGLPAIITNCSNNYGPYQFPEKLIPLMILNALEGRSLPIYGDGGNVRDWLYVEDHCAGLRLVLERGRVGEKYNIGGGGELRNVDVVDRLCAVLERTLPARENPALATRGRDGYAGLKAFVADRPGHDRRYAIDSSKIRAELGWSPEHDFDSGLARTVEWYLSHRDWCEAVQSSYRRDRLGLDRAGDAD
ncbi:MAG: dTDP-glucose 4,6-dehydratase [Vicinamibacteria bacterium]|nr:dTDP-glucose 4,6-dehydratase [Vicinamibacteria bacterium]